MSPSENAKANLNLLWFLLEQVEAVSKELTLKPAAHLHSAYRSVVKEINTTTNASLDTLAEVGKDIHL